VDKVTMTTDAEETLATVAMASKGIKKRNKEEDDDDTTKCQEDSDNDHYYKSNLIKKEFDIDEISFSTDESYNCLEDGEEEEEEEIEENYDSRKKLQPTYKTRRSGRQGIDTSSVAINSMPALRPGKKNVARKTVLHTIVMKTKPNKYDDANSHSDLIEDEKVAVVSTKTTRKKSNTAAGNISRKASKGNIKTRATTRTLTRKKKSDGGRDELNDAQLRKAIYCSIRTTIDDTIRCCDCKCNCNGTALVPLDGEFERIADEYNIDITTVSNVWNYGQLLVIQDIVRMAATNVFRLSELEASNISIARRESRRPTTRTANTKHKASVSTSLKESGGLLTLDMINAAAKACNIQPDLTVDPVYTIAKPPLLLPMSKSTPSSRKKTRSRNNNSNDGDDDDDIDSQDTSTISAYSETKNRSPNPNKKKSSTTKNDAVRRKSDLAKKTVSSSRKRKHNSEDENDKINKVEKKMTRAKTKSSNGNDSHNKEENLLMTDSDSDGPGSVDDNDSVSSSIVNIYKASDKNDNENTNNATQDGTKTKQRRHLPVSAREAIFHLLQSKYDHKLERMAPGHMRKVGRKFNVGRNVMARIWKQGINSIQEQKEKLQLAADAGDTEAAITLASGNIRPDMETHKRQRAGTRKHDPEKICAMIDAIPITERKSLRQTAKLIGISSTVLHDILKRVNPKPNTVDTKEIELKLQLKQQRIMSNRINCGVRNDKARYRKKLEKTQQVGTTPPTTTTTTTVAPSQLINNNDDGVINTNTDGGSAATSVAAENETQQNPRKRTTFTTTTTSPVLPTAINNNVGSVLAHEHGHDGVGVVGTSGASPVYHSIASPQQQQDLAGSAAAAVANDVNHDNTPYIGVLTAAHQQQAYMHPHAYHRDVGGSLLATAAMTGSYLANIEFPLHHQMQNQQRHNQQQLHPRPSQAEAGSRSESYWY
jgi:hypothetical protein